MDRLSKTNIVVSIILKAVTILSAVTGTILSAYAGARAFMGGATVFMYFTIQSNIAIAIICAVGLCMMLRRSAVNRVWYVIKFVGTVSITLTGMVFGFVLAPTLGAEAWNIQNTLTHLIVPVASVLDFFVVSSVTRIDKRNVLWVIIPPILYAIYAGIGFVRGWEFSPGVNYPYFFLNWGSPAGAFGFSKELPFMGSAWWIAALLVFLIVVGALYLFIADVIAKKDLAISL
ncbi:MAG: Pr6Pr family membrane protein [Lachnospiraceae bacterium]|nr:Pr6Pr family membrane protein [Lachnospiraceae bacterium]